MSDKNQIRNENEANANRSIRLSDETFHHLKEMAKRSSYEDVIRNSIARYDNALLEEEGILGPQLAIVNELSDSLMQCFNSIVNTANNKLHLQQEKFDKQLKMYTDKIDELKGTIENYKTESNELQKNLEHVSDKNKELSEEHSKMSHEKDVVKIELEQLKADFDKKMAEIKEESEKAKEDLRINIKSRDDSISIKQERIDRLENELSELKEENKKVQAFKDEKDELLLEISNIERQHEAHVKEKEEECRASLWGKEQELIKYYTNELEKLRHSHQLELEKMRNERAIAIEKAREDATERQFAYFTERLEKKDEKIDDLRAQIIRLQQENEILKRPKG